MFLIKNIEVYKNIASKFESFVLQMIDKQIIKQGNHGKQDFLSPELINLNYKKIDYIYQKNLTPNELD
jgi:hypothetical protein